MAHQLGRSARVREDADSIEEVIAMPSSQTQKIVLTLIERLRPLETQWEYEDQQCVRIAQQYASAGRSR